MIVRVRVGSETLIVGPRAEFAALVAAHATQASALASEYEVRRRLLIALADPALAGELRRAFGRWREEGPRLGEADDRALIDRVAQMTRNGMLAAFVVSDRSKHHGRAAAAAAERTLEPAAAAAAAGVAEMDLQERIEATLRLVPNHLSGATREEFLKLIEPQAIALTSGVLAVWAVSHFFGVGEIIDVLLIAAGVVLAGPQFWLGVKKLRHALELVQTATSPRALDEAAQAFADMIATLGVAVLVAAITHGAGKRAARWKEKKASLRNKPLEKVEKAERISVRGSSQKAAASDTNVIPSAGTATKTEVGSAKLGPSGQMTQKPRDPRLKENLDRKWFKEDGSLRWPNGEEPGTLPNGFREEPYRDVIQPGTVLDRYGSESGNFLSPSGTPYGQRALPYDASKLPYNQYTVVKPLPVSAGRAAPCFDEPGGGVQYLTNMSISDLIAEGYLVGGAR